jgi:uncharacterized protein YbjT (DUF2867 family)
MKTAWLAGASGLVGSELLSALLLDSGLTVLVSFGRRTLEAAHPKLEQRLVDFAAFDAQGAPPPDVAFCALGTTIGKAGSKEAFRAVDHDAVLAFAEAARAAGAGTFIVVTALGADQNSRIFYNRVKGETERDLHALGFRSLAILRPSLLLGNRRESRPSERAAIVASRWLAPVLKPFAARPIEATRVAHAALAIAHEPPTGVREYPSGELQRLGNA